MATTFLASGKGVGAFCFVRRGRSLKTCQEDDCLSCRAAVTRASRYLSRISSWNALQHMHQYAVVMLAFQVGHVFFLWDLWDLASRADMSCVDINVYGVFNSICCKRLGMTSTRGGHKPRI